MTDALRQKAWNMKERDALLESAAAYHDGCVHTQSTGFRGGIVAGCGCGSCCKHREAATAIRSLKTPTPS